MMFEALYSCDLFAGIKKEDIPAILTCLDSKTKRYARGDFIIKAGEPLSHVGIVLEGCAHLIQEDYWGNCVLIEQLYPGDAFGESFACDPEAVLSLSCRAAKDTTVMFIDYQQIITVCSSACVFHLRLIKNMVASIAHKNIGLTRKIEHTNKRTIHDKVLSYFSTQALLNKSSSFELPFSRQEFADYLAVDRASLSRSLGQMQSEGLFLLEGRKVTLFDASI